MFAVNQEEQKRMQKEQEHIMQMVRVHGLTHPGEKLSH